jgi:hypothetical protein
MSIYVMSRVWAGSRHKGGALLLMLALADFAHDDGTNAYPSIATLARKTRMSDRQVQRLIQQCEKSGELLAQRSTDGRSSTLYTIVLDAFSVTGVKRSPVPQRAQTGDISVTRTVLVQPSEDSDTGGDAERLWLATLEQLSAKLARGQLDDFEGTRGLRLDGETLIVVGPAALNRKWAAYLRGVLGRPVRFELVK